jgi:hypothetical protein
MYAVNFIGVAAACVLATAACTSVAEPPGRPATTNVGQPPRTAAPNVPGAPQKTDAGNVPTAPITIPPIFDKQGRPIDEVRDEVAAEIRTACGGGELCVNLAVAVGSNDSFTQCEYETSEPASHPDEAFVLERGSTLTLVTGSEPCETTTTETTEPETTGETTTETTTNVEPTG